MTFQESVRALLGCPVPDEEQSAILENLGLEPIMLNWIHYMVVDRAARGDVTAVRYLRDTAGEKESDMGDCPIAALDLTRLTDEELQRLAAEKGE